ncbi:MAG: hypothetical protein K9I95_10520 [Flavobacteriaceae bacterium]|nr:hypothetical protein [Flavobacteriaceae bacterium]
MNKNKFFLFLYAATTRVFIDLVGRLMLAEIIALVTLPSINIRKLLKKFEGLKTVLVGLAVFLTAQIISDIVNQSDSSDYLRGWAMIVFSMVSTIYLVNHLSKDSYGIVYYLFGLFIVLLIFGEGDLDLGAMAENTNYFKARFVGFLNPLLILVAYQLYRKNNKRLVSLLFLAFGLICMILDARSNGLIFIISAVLVYIKTTGIRFSRFKIILLGVIISGILYAGFIFYVNQVLHNGIGGSNARTQLNMASNPYNPFELIYYGRSDFFVLVQAVADKPIFGHGSWGKDTQGKYSEILMLISDKINSNDIGYIPAHSVFLGSWAYAGIIGFISILVVFLTLFKYSLKIYKSKIKSHILPIIIILSLDMLWAFLFSPLGTLRTSFPIFAAIIIVEYKRLLMTRQIQLLIETKSKFNNNVL